jgi:peptidyl-Lys metalloendopeptidase
MSIAVVFVVFVAAVTSAEMSFLTSRISVGQINSDAFLVTFSLTNPTKATIGVPSHLTPFKGLTHDIFQIEGPGEVEYTGILAKRLSDAADMIELNPGKTMTVELDLSRDYAFSIAGSYRIAWRFGEAQFGSFEVKEALGDRRFGANADTAAAPIGFQNCDASQRTQVLAADSIATSDSRSAYACLSGNTCSGRYTTWFGANTAPRYQKTTQNFLAIRNTFNAGNYRISCNGTSCSSNTYAYVFPTDRLHLVYLCGVFWRIPSERAETLVHEMSHFNDVAGTRDFSYGQPACKNLARSNPANAIANADNLCYFAHGYTLTNQTEVGPQ